MLRLWISFCVHCLVLVCGASTVFSQQSSSGNSNGSGAERGPNAGGAAMADFDTLMNLIQQTIDPDSWLANGGTSTILPYPAGVWVDAKGQLKRRELNVKTTIAVEDKLRQATNSTHETNNVWQTASDLRVVSLRGLEQTLVAASLARTRINADVIRLAGINRIEYVLIDTAREDVLLAGPANPAKLGCLLEDLCTVCAVINQQTSPLGCSIEPNQQRLLATQQFLSKAETGRMLSSSPLRFSEQLSKVIGDYEVHYFGLNSHSGTATALLAADEHMKQLGFGKVHLPIALKTYFEHLESMNSIPRESLIRWWFAYSDEPVAVNERRDLFRLPLNCVRVLSEQQFVTETGRRPTGKNDAAADAFAAEMSGQMDRLRELEPNYSRLCCVFESALALQLALETTGLPEFKAWFPTLCRLGTFQAPDAQEAKTVSGLAKTHVLKKSKTNVAVISGGVTVGPKEKVASDPPDISPLLTGSAVPQLPADGKATNWWWD